MMGAGGGGGGETIDARCVSSFVFDGSTVLVRLHMYLNVIRLPRFDFQPPAWPDPRLQMTVKSSVLSIRLGCPDLRCLLLSSTTFAFSFSSIAVASSEAIRPGSRGTGPNRLVLAAAHAGRHDASAQWSIAQMGAAWRSRGVRAGKKASVCMISAPAHCECVSSED